MNGDIELTVTIGATDASALDELVAAGLSSDRSGAVRIAVAGLRERLAADREGTIREILHDPDLDALVEWVSRHPVPLDD